MATLTPRFGPIWAGASRLLRSRFRYEELVELVPLSDRWLLAFVGGEIIRLDLATGRQEHVHELRYFGLGKGRGVMPHGVARDDGGAIYYGEYATGSLGPQETIRLWRSRDAGTTWETAHEFGSGAVRHVHAVQWDPYGRALWITTGDRDSESRIGYSKDGGSSFTWIGAGSQTFRAVSLIFQPDAVRWAMDSERGPAHIVSWDRRSRRLERSRGVLPSPGYYSQALAPTLGLVSAAEGEASLWLVMGGEPQPLLRWSATPKAGLPHASVRLVRSATGANDSFVYANPLRTDDESAAIYRFHLLR